MNIASFSSAPPSDSLVHASLWWVLSQWEGGRKRQREERQVGTGGYTSLHPLKSSQRSGNYIPKLLPPLLSPWVAGLYPWPPGSLFISHLASQCEERDTVLTLLASCQRAEVEGSWGFWNQLQFSKMLHQKTNQIRDKTAEIH